MLLKVLCILHPCLFISWFLASCSLEDRVLNTKTLCKFESPCFLLCARMFFFGLCLSRSFVNIANWFSCPLGYISRGRWLRVAVTLCCHLSLRTLGRREPTVRSALHPRVVPLHLWLIQKLLLTRYLPRAAVLTGTSGRVQDFIFCSQEAVAGMCTPALCSRATPSVVRGVQTVTALWDETACSLHRLLSWPTEMRRQIR